MKKTFTLEEVKQLAFWAVQYSSKLEGKGQKTIHKHEIDSYIESELYNFKTT